MITDKSSWKNLVKRLLISKEVKNMALFRDKESRADVVVEPFALTVARCFSQAFVSRLEIDLHFFDEYHFGAVEKFCA